MATPEALRRLAQTRDPEAWAALLHRHGPELLRLARRITNDPGLAEDVCQETLLQVRQHAGKFRPPPGEQAPLAARTWIMRIAYHVALKLLRTRRRAAAREVREEVVARSRAAGPGPAERAISKEEAQALRQEVEALPESLRLPVMLHFYGEMDYPELSAALECSQETARQRVHRGVDRLRRRLALLGAALAVAELPALLTGGAAQAAEVSAALGTGAGTVTLEAGRLAAWQALLDSPAAPALTGVLPAAGMAPALKLTLGLAAAVLAGAVACAVLADSGKVKAPAPPGKARAVNGEAQPEKSAALWRDDGEPREPPLPNFVPTPADTQAREDRLRQFLETRRVSFEYEDTTLADAVGYLRSILAEEFTETEIQVDPALADEPVRGLKVTGTPLGLAVEETAAFVDAKVVRHGPILRIVPRAGADGRPLRKSPRDF
jgi:RNA polymerase sigma-70 factor (ECF subfamily)